MAVGKVPENGPSYTQLAGLVAFIVAAGLLALSVTVMRKGDATPAMTGGVLISKAEDQPLPDVDTMITKLAARLETTPDDGEGFRMLGWSYLMVGRPQDALAPYRRAMELLPDDASVISGYAEALTAASNGAVTRQAQDLFERALEIDPAEPRARFFVARHAYQQGYKREALDQFIALADSTPGDAAWQNEVDGEIQRLSQELGVAVSPRNVAQNVSGSDSSAPKIDAQAIADAENLSPAQRDAMIDNMVEGLAARLATNPKDPEGWARLIRSRAVRGEFEQASRDLAMARRSLTTDAAGLTRVEATALEMGIR